MLAVLAAGAGTLTVWASWSGGVVDYYAAAAVSMGRSWPDFLWGAVDPAGTVTVDKIPGGLWLPALSVRVFGYSPAAVIVPSALAMVAAVVVTAVAARRVAGVVAGGVAGVAVATTPVLVAVSRSNQPESYLVLTMALTAWAAVHALQQRSVAWLCAAGVFAALGFQVYMALAWAVWPALAAAYVCTRQSWRRRLGHIGAAASVSVAVSLAWVVVAAVVPAGDRPYLGSTLHDNPWEMVFGYDGLGRFVSAPTVYRSYAPPFSGPPGPLRLWDASLAAQIGWLLPAAACAIIVLVVLRAAVWQPVLLGVWLLTLAVVLSLAAGMHEFTTAVVAVPAALALGIGFGRARQAGSRLSQTALIIVCAATAVVIAGTHAHPSLPVAIVQAAVAAGAVAVVMTHGAAVTRPAHARVRTGIGLVVVVVAMVLSPAVWSGATIGRVSAGDPTAGGALADAPLTAAVAVSPRTPAGARTAAHTSAAPAGAALSAPVDDGALLRYARRHSGSARYTIAVFGATRAAALIVRSGGRSVLPIGGYAGADPAPTLDAFTAMVQAGDVRVVQIPGFASSAPPAASAARRILVWVETDCRLDMRAPEPGVYRCGRA